MVADGGRGEWTVVYYVRSGDTLLDPEENWVSGEKIRALQAAAW